MILYRLLRYFAALFFVTGVILFAVRHSFAPFPPAARAFTAIESYYSSLAYAEEIRAESGQPQKILADSAKRILNPLNQALDRFLSDENVIPSLEDIRVRRFDDLEYLIRTHLIRDETFRDLRIIFQGEVLYKYENVPVNSPLVLTRALSVGGQTWDIEAFYMPALLYQAVSVEEIPLALKLKSDLIFSKSSENRFFEQALSKITAENLPDGFGIALRNRAKIVHYYKYTQNVQAPLLFFMVETLPALKRSYGQFFFLLALAAGLILLIILDRFILMFFKMRARQKERRQVFAEFRKESPSAAADENALKWLDALVRSDLNTPGSDSVTDKRENNHDNSAPKDEGDPHEQ